MVQSLLGQKLQIFRRLRSKLLLCQYAQPCLLRVQVLALDTQDLIHTLVQVLARQEVFDGTHALHVAHAIRTLADEDAWLVVSSLEAVDEVIKCIRVLKRLLITALMGDLVAFLIF